MLLQMVRFHSFLWSSNIQLYVCTTAFLSTCLLMGTWVLHILAIAAMNIGVHIFLQISGLGFFQHIEIKSLNHNAVPFFRNLTSTCCLLIY